MNRLNVFTLLMLMSIPAIATEEISIKLEGHHRIDTYQTPYRIILQGVASDKQSYEVNVSCINAQRNTTGIDEGFIQIYSGNSHVGSATKIEFDTCLDLVSDLKEQQVNLELTFDKKAHEALAVGPVAYEIY